MIVWPYMLFIWKNNWRYFACRNNRWQPDTWLSIDGVIHLSSQLKESLRRTNLIFSERKVFDPNRHSIEIINQAQDWKQLNLLRFIWKQCNIIMITDKRLLFRLFCAEFQLNANTHFCVEWISLHRNNINLSH